jgi:hypothetical protein
VQCTILLIVVKCQRSPAGPPLTIVSDQEILLHSGEHGFQVEVESMGLSVSLIAEVNERVVVLTCFGELEPSRSLRSPWTRLSSCSRGCR